MSNSFYITNRRPYNFPSLQMYLPNSMSLKGNQIHVSRILVSRLFYQSISLVSCKFGLKINDGRGVYMVCMVLYVCQDCYFVVCKGIGVVLNVILRFLEKFLSGRRCSLELSAFRFSLSASHTLTLLH